MFLFVSTLSIWNKHMHECKQAKAFLDMYLDSDLAWMFSLHIQTRSSLCSVGTWNWWGSTCRHVNSHQPSVHMHKVLRRVWIQAQYVPDWCCCSCSWVSGSFNLRLRSYNVMKSSFEDLSTFPSASNQDTNAPADLEAPGLWVSTIFSTLAWNQSSLPFLSAHRACTCFCLSSFNLRRKSRPSFTWFCTADAVVTCVLAANEDDIEGTGNGSGIEPCSASFVNFCQIPI